MIRILIESATVGIVELCVILHLVGTAEKRQVGVRLVSGLLEHLVLPVHVRINKRVAAVLELLQLCIRIGGSATIVQTSAVQGVCIVVGTNHVGTLRVELDLVRKTGLEVILAVLGAVLGLYQQNTVDTFVTIEGHSYGILQYGHTLYFFYCQAIDRTFDAIYQNQNTGFARNILHLTVTIHLSSVLGSSLNTADVECSTTAFLTFETCVLECIQSK